MPYNQKIAFRDGHLRIMQIADTQELPLMNPDTVKLIRLAVEKAKPDLVIFTGDQIYGPIPLYKGNTREKVRKVLSALLAPLEENSIPFLVAFGNHDRECGISNAEQMKMYAESPMCAGGSYANDLSSGLFNLPVYGKNGKVAFSIYVFDSNGEAEAGAYKAIGQNQLDDYAAVRDTLKEENGDYVPSLVFQHIPPWEVMNVIHRVPKGTKGAVEAFHAFKDQYYVLPASAIEKGEFMGESPAVPKTQSGQFDVLAEKGDIFGIFFGHDHINSFVLPYRGIDLGYTQGTGFNVYGPGRNRGVRVFDIPEDDPRAYTNFTLTFGELTADRVHNPLFELIQPIMPTSVMQVKKLIKPVAIVSAAVLTAAGIAVAAICGKKR